MPCLYVMIFDCVHSWHLLHLDLVRSSHPSPFHYSAFRTFHTFLDPTNMRPHQIQRVLDSQCRNEMLMLLLTTKVRVKTTKKTSFEEQKKATTNFEQRTSNSSTKPRLKLSEVWPRSIDWVLGQISGPMSGFVSVIDLWRGHSRKFYLLFYHQVQSCV